MEPFPKSHGAGLPPGDTGIVTRVNSSRSALMSVAALLTCVAALAVAGCGGTVVDSQKAEDAIQQNIESSTKLTVESVSCPDNVDVEAGATFDCDIKFADGKTAKATLKILNNDADVKITKLVRT